MSTPTKRSRKPSRLLPVAALAISLASGCTSLITPHHTYAPLLDHAGQLDVAVRAGPSVPGGVGLSGNLAYAPIDNFEIVAGGDVNLAGSTRHYGGQLGVGVFARDDMLRLEAIAGVYGGAAEGEANGFFPGGVPADDGFYVLEGPYMLPYAQVFVGFEREHFELAGGVRLSGFFADVSITPNETSEPWLVDGDGYERMYIEPSLTVRFPFDWFRVDLSTGFPIAIAGDESPGGLAPEGDVTWFLAAGVGFQLDTMEPEPHPEYEVLPPEPQPVMTLVPAPAPPPSYDPPPPAPPPASPPPASPPPAPPPSASPESEPVFVPIPG